MDSDDCQRARTHVCDGRPVGYPPGLDFSSHRDVSHCLSAGRPREDDRAISASSVLICKLRRIVEARIGRGRKTVGNIQRAELQCSIDTSGDRRVHRIISGPDNVQNMSRHIAVDAESPVAKYESRSAIIESASNEIRIQVMP
jgi:hypothetical protein